MQFSYVDYMAMWTRLDELIVPVCRAIAQRLHLKSANVLDAAARFHGFSGHEGLRVGLGVASRANYLLEEFINHERESALTEDDASFLKALTADFEQCGDIAEALEGGSEEVSIEERACATEATENQEVTFESPIFDALAELRENLLWCFTSSGDSPFSPNAFTHAVEFSDFLATEGLAEDGVSREACLAAICEARHPFFFLETGPGFWQNLIDTVDNPAWAKDRRAAVPDMKDVLQELSSDGVTRLYRRYPDAVELRNALKHQPTEFFDLAVESGPTFYLALAHAPNNARFHVNAARDIFAPEGAQESGALWLEIYIPSRDDLAKVLWCSPSKPEYIEPIGLDEARQMGAPDLAGWYKVAWS
ncbi:hypothetical protein [Burkholderia ubonensis]|uniref:hypothetical protein n=1 Tax=Burkholderia ubonensis TaxID=101571 RepID=UPI000753B712|nr:hypothetical protein [Burkholderia ubonensis]KVP17383.1 hypothetical protein WJ84_03900 [Burkholderia ubonensis]